MAFQYKLMFMHESFLAELLRDNNESRNEFNAYRFVFDENKNELADIIQISSAMQINGDKFL